MQSITSTLFYQLIHPHIIKKNLNNLCIQTTTNSPKTIRNIINTDKNNNYQITSEADIYANPCNMCNKICLWRTSRTVKGCIYEHIWFFKLNNVHKVLVKHNLETKHSFNFKDFKTLVKIHYKEHWKIVKSSIISCHNTIKQRPDF